ncbi:MAG: penicillin-binding protein 2 [Planctomycetaceae bacterium]
MTNGETDPLPQQTDTPLDDGASGETHPGSQAATTADSDCPHPSAPLPEVSRWRALVVVTVPLLLAIGLAARLVELQWVRHDEFARRANRLRRWEEPVAAQPGDILDREGRLLATSVATRSLFVDPAFVDDPAQLAARLAVPLGLDVDRLTALLEQSRDRRFVWIKRRLTTAEADAVRELTLPREQVGFRNEFKRHYPQGTIAAHVLGLRDIDNVGRGGLEEACEAVLRGTDGRRAVQRDARGYIVDVSDTASIPAANGQPVRTTIDSLLQVQVERRLDEVMKQWQPRSATAIVMRPQSAEILALACRPAFDPNHPELAPADGWKNQAIASIFEPGSTFKPFVVGWAMELNQLAPDELLDCEYGAYRMGRRILHDHHAYSELSVADVLVKSSNIGMAKIGERLGNTELQRMVRAFGFGAPTGLGLPGELTGIVRPDAKWDGYSTGSIPMGQEIAVTPMQLITAHAALANGGRLLAPTLLLSTTQSGTLESRPPIARNLLTPSSANWLVQEAMTAVVDRGTGREAKLKGYSVFGKTGTSQVVDPETGGYSHQRHICSFICGAPAESPEALVLVLIEEPAGDGAHYGGTVAAPAARDILSNALELLSVPPRLARDAQPPTR